MYEKLADIYDAMYHFKDYRKESPKVVQSIRGVKPDARTLLEVACGTGLYLEQLKQQFQVEGLDLSPQMLARARERLPDVPLHHGDMADFDLGRRFDVVCILFRSIAFAGTKERFGTAIASMARHVEPGGVLMVEPYFTPQSYWVDRVTLNEYKSDDLKIAWMYVSEKVGLIGRQDVHCLVGTPEGVTHFTELHELGLFDRDDYEKAFASAGLQLVYEAEGPSGTGLYMGLKA